MISIEKNPLALDTFRGKIATLGLESAVAWARDAGFSVKPELLPTPVLDRRAALVAHTRDESAVDAFDAVNADALATERRALQLAAIVADGGTGYTAAEEAARILRREAGLDVLASVDRLLALGQSEALDRFEQAFFRELHEQRIERDARTDVAREHKRIELERARARRQVLATAPCAANGEPIETASIRAQLDEVDQHFDVLLARAEHERMSSAASPKANAWIGGLMSHRGGQSWG